MASEIIAVGRRKTSIARVRIRKGKGNIMVNGRRYTEYFPTEALQNAVLQPLDVLDAVGAYDIRIRVTGGGTTGQAGAVRMGIARALNNADASNRGTLKRNGFLSRDDRMVERKKYGRKGARRSFQFSKR